MKQVLIILWLALPLYAEHPLLVRAKGGAIASRSEIASQVGVEIMQAGGNAIDAAVAVGFALAVTYPSAGNLGGGGFMVLRLANGDTTTLDFREMAPKSASRDMYLDEEGNVVDGLSTRSHKAAGVPGTVDGLLEALERYGTKTRREVLAPAIKLAKEGFPLTYDLADQFKRQLTRMKKYPGSMAKFSKKGEPYSAGELWVQPDLAATLERIATQGRNGFYKGKTAQLIVEEMKRGHGEITQEDLAGYTSKWREPVKGTYRDYQVVSMPPPSSGGVLLIQMLNILEAYDLKSMGWGAAEYIHHLVEAQRRAYADRAEYLGDPDFVQVPIEKLMDKAYARKRFEDFDPNRASDSETIGHGDWFKESPETTHFSVMDAHGNAVACTTTLNWGYGSRITVQGAGFLLNNEMDDFSIKPNTSNTYGLLGRKANAIQPKKRMLSSMTPTILLKDGQPFLVTGSPGGSSIINTVLQVILNVVDHEMTLANAVGLPRFHHQWKPDKILYEPYRFSPDTLAVLKQKGHKEISTTRWRIGDANTILFKDKEIRAVSDRRNDGGASGY